MPRIALSWPGTRVLQRLAEGDSLTAKGWRAPHWDLSPEIDRRSTSDAWQFRSALRVIELTRPLPVCFRPRQAPVYSWTAQPRDQSHGGVYITATRSDSVCLLVGLVHCQRSDCRRNYTSLKARRITSPLT